ncbi:retrovirus-related Pol polyprotein from transposon 412 [Trichonephila clavipes]|nr:retrovirus-related Pol polyprotein from transposon 412 [Trichonephila clavipes]
MHFQSNLPPNPCRFCERQGIQNDYHWAQTCPFKLSAIQAPLQISMQPNVDPPTEESQISQLLERSGYIKKKPLPCILDTGSTISIISHFVSKYDVGQLRVEPQRIILKSDLPVPLRPYRTSPIQEKEIKSQAEKLLQAGLIKESNSPYSAPVTLAFKHDEGKKTRLCIDFRKLNALCKADSEPLPIMDSLLDKLARAKFFSTLDLASGY